MNRSFGNVAGIINQPQGLDIGLSAGGGGLWMLDWSAYQIVYDIDGNGISVPTNSWQTFVDIAGKGFLKYCLMDSAFVQTANPEIRITVDGQAYTFASALAGVNSQGNQVDFEIPFNTSLKIEGFNRYTGAATLWCDYIYLLQQANPNPNNITLLQQSQRKMAYLDTASATLVDVVNVTGSGYLLGVHFLGINGSANILGDITVDGVNKMSSRAMFHPTSDQAKTVRIPGPIRFTSSLLVRTRVSTGGPRALCFVWYSLD